MNIHVTHVFERLSRPTCPRILRLRIALVLCLCVGTGCGSGGGAPGGGTGIGTMTIGGSEAGAGGGAALELTGEPSVTERTVIGTVGAAWSALPSVFETLGIEATVMERGSFRFGNPRFVARRIAGSRMSRFLDCGSVPGGPRANRYRITLGVMVDLAAAGGGGTLITTTVDAYAEPRDVSGNAVRCASTRVLERRIAELIAYQVAGESPG